VDELVLGEVAEREQECRTRGGWGESVAPEAADADREGSCDLHDRVLGTIA